jgi:hypothetical protein
MKRWLVVAGYAIGGLMLAVGLSISAYLVAGRNLSKPVQPVRVSVPLAPPRASPASSASPRATKSPTARASTDDRKVSDDHGGTVDPSGHDGSGSDSGHGSDDSGDD